MDNLLYCGDLNALVESGCSAPGCDHEDHDEMYFHCRCDLSGQIEVSYERGSGALVIGCMECGQTMARIAVANNGARTQ